MRSKGNQKLTHHVGKQVKYYPEFSARINYLILTGKVKVYQGLTEFKNRQK